MSPADSTSSCSSPDTRISPPRAWLAMLGSEGDLRRKLDRLPLITTLVTLVLILTFPLGPKLQETVTTDANLGGLRVVGINHFQRGRMPVHQVLTRDLLEA